MFTKRSVKIIFLYIYLSFSYNIIIISLTFNKVKFECLIYVVRFFFHVVNTKTKLRTLDGKFKILSYILMN